MELNLISNLGFKGQNGDRSLYRSSRPEVFYEKGVLRNFTKFTGKHLCQRKKRLWHRCFRVNFAKFLRTPFLTEHLRWLLLPINILHWRNTLSMKNCLLNCYLGNSHHYRIGTALERWQLTDTLKKGKTRS